TARMMIGDGGLDADAHPNSSPLTAGLIALAAAPGRESASLMLEHDVTRMAQLWFLAALAGTVLAGLVGLRATQMASAGIRIGAAVVSALVASSWFVWGFALQFGFVNATIALVVMLAAWLAWLEARVAPILGSAVLSLAAVAMLATWAPLAAVPGVLAAM